MYFAHCFCHAAPSIQACDIWLKSGKQIDEGHDKHKGVAFSCC